jgi:hypothetical protein
MVLATVFGFPCELLANYKIMKLEKILITAIITVLSASAVLAQRPGGGRGGDWFNRVDANKNGNIEMEEFRTATDSFFKMLDRNNDGVIDQNERPQRPRPFPPRPDGNRPEPGPEGQPPPFFVMESLRSKGNVTREEYDRNAEQQFRAMDKNNDGVISRGEARAGFEDTERRREDKDRPDDFPPRPFDSPTARFIEAEIRFGDKLVKDAPFSAETVMENTRRLFDGSTVTKQTKGAIYRDSAGRTRREQPLETIGGFGVLGENKQPQKLIFINDAVTKTHYFLDLNRKVAQKRPLPDNQSPLREKTPKDGKTESLGTKTMEGVSVEGTRTTFEIPVGQIGNDKPIQVVTETWFSPELQMIVMSRHVDPLAGEHIFRLVNIKRGEPSSNLFTVPSDFKVEESPKREPRRND